MNHCSQVINKNYSQVVNAQVDMTGNSAPESNVIKQDTRNVKKNGLTKRGSDSQKLGVSK